jgi:hypothetical protein
MVETNAVVKYINDYGFPIIAAGGMGYIVHFVWIWATTLVKPVLDDAYVVLVNLIDKVRALDSDMIRLNQKLVTVLMLKGK